MLVAGCFDVDATPEATGADWRMYGRGPGRTRHVPDARLSRDGVDVAWERQVSASSWLPPVVANGVGYCQYANGLFVLDPATGEGPNVGTYGGFGRGGPMAFGSTAAYDDGVLVVPYGDTVGGYAADPERWPDEVSGLGERRARWWTDGDETGTRPVGGVATDVRWGATPVVSGGSVVGVNGFSNTAWAVDTDDGSVHWRYDLRDAVENVSEPLGLVVDESTGTVVVGVRDVSDPGLVAIDVRDGTSKWTDESGDGGDLGPADRNALAAGDGRVYVVDGADSDETVRLRELDAKTGDTSWTRSFERHRHNGVAVGGEAIYHLGTVGDRSSADEFAVAAVDRADGEVHWEERLADEPGFDFGVTVQPPTIAGDCLLVPGGDGLHALDRTNGEHLWTFTELVGTAGGSETERVASTPAVVTDDRIVLGMTIGLYGLE